MSFKLEKDMVPFVQENLLKMLGDMNYLNSDELKLFANELPVSYRMIDMAITSVDKKIIEKCKDSKYNNSFKTLNTILLDMLSIFYIKKEVSTHYFRKAFCISLEKIRILLDNLIKLDLIEQISMHMYKATDWVNDIPEEIIAIELKLSKWEEALEQGVYNLSFADYSLVILDEEKVPKIKNIEKYFSECNVGLVYVNTNGHIKYLNVPKINKKKNQIKSGFQKIKIMKDLLEDKKWRIIEA